MQMEQARVLCLGVFLEPGTRRAGTQNSDIHPCSAQLATNSSRERQHITLGREIHRHTGATRLKARKRRDIEYITALPIYHAWQRKARKRSESRYIEMDHALDVFKRFFGEVT